MNIKRNTIVCIGSSNSKQKQLNDMLKIKDKMIDKNETLIKQKDKMIEYLETQLNQKQQQQPPQPQPSPEEPEPMRKGAPTSIIKNKRTKTVEFKDLPEDMAPQPSETANKIAAAKKAAKAEALIRKKSTTLSSQYNLDSKMGKMSMVREFYIRLASY